MSMTEIAEFFKELGFFYEPDKLFYNAFSMICSKLMAYSFWQQFPIK